MLARAEALGFKTYALSEHVPRQYSHDLYPEEREADVGPSDLSKTFQAYVIEAKRLQKQYGDEVVKGKKSMKVLVAAETENLSPDTIRWLKGDVFAAHETETSEDSSSNGAAVVGHGLVDYLVGSVHHAGGILPPELASTFKPSPVGIPIDFDQAIFDQAVEYFTLPEEQRIPLHERRKARFRLCLSYFEAQYQLLGELRPEVIGHFDLCRLFMPDLVLLPSSPSSSDQDNEEASLCDLLTSAILRNIRYAISYKALFEINSASLRKSWKTPYPGKDILQQILKLGGRVCLSDDAHGPGHVAISYHQTRDYLIDMGVESIWYLELDEEPSSQESKSKDQESAAAPTRFPRGTRAVEVKGWANDGFWDGLEEIRRREN